MRGWGHKFSLPSCCCVYLIFSPYFGWQSDMDLATVLQNAQHHGIFLFSYLLLRTSFYIHLLYNTMLDCHIVYECCYYVLFNLCSRLHKSIKYIKLFLIFSIRSRNTKFCRDFLKSSNRGSICKYHRNYPFLFDYLLFLLLLYRRYSGSIRTCLVCRACHWGQASAYTSTCRAVREKFDICSGIIFTKSWLKII